MADETLQQSIIDEEHLKLLTVGYFVSAGLPRSSRCLAYCMHWWRQFPCLEIPYGTLLGIFTFLVLGRNSVRGLSEAPAALSSAGEKL